MNAGSSLVTGAAGFVGSRVVRALRRRGIAVRAGVHEGSERRPERNGVETVPLELRSPASLDRALRGVETVYHFAAVLHAEGGGTDRLVASNVEGTRNLCEAATRNGVRGLLYCSSAAVYGLLAAGSGPISERTEPRAFEPYGRSKLAGERIALDLAEANGIRTIVIRPAAVFGPGERTPVGRRLRRAVVSRILLPGPFSERGFSYVHVEDVAGAAVHLMETASGDEKIYNVVVSTPISFEDAFRAYRRALRRIRRPMIRARVLAEVSNAAQRFPSIVRLIPARRRGRLLFTVWRPGFDLVYSSDRLLATDYRFRLPSFERVVRSCLEGA